MAFLKLLAWSSLVAAVLACDLTPGDDAAPKSPGDNFYRILITEVDRYAPGQRYAGKFFYASL